MKKLLLAAIVVLLASVTADAQSCAKCYTTIQGSMFCGLTSYNGAQTCVATQGYICTLTGACQGTDGEECQHVCVHYRWTDGSRALPEKAPYVVAKVEIIAPERTKS
jgi:hypothetical protein